MKLERLQAGFERQYGRLDRRLGGVPSLLVHTALAFNQGDGPLVARPIAYYTLTAEFGANDNLSGNSGCNTYNGPYRVTGDQIEIGPLATSRMACSEPAGVIEQEALYLAALETAATYQIEGMTLELRTRDGALAADFSRKRRWMGQASGKSQMLDGPR